MIGCRRLPAAAAAACLTAGALALAGSGCTRLYRFEPAAVIDAIRLRDGEAALGPAGPRPMLGLTMRDHRGRVVKVPPHAALTLETAAGPVTAAPRTLALRDGLLAAGDTTVPAADLRGASLRRKNYLPLALGALGIMLVFGAAVWLGYSLQRL